MALSVADMLPSGRMEQSSHTAKLITAVMPTMLICMIRSCTVWLLKADMAAAVIALTTAIARSIRRSASVNRDPTATNTAKAM